MRNASALYASLQPFVNAACRLFYRNLQVTDSHKVSGKDAPIILISNHQNALLDPLLCCITSPTQLNFLTRADVFKKPMVKKILFSLNMLPVYRPHDKVNILESNVPTFQESLKRLEQNNIMSLFPEGTHDREQNLMPFKKGAARLICDLFESGKKDKVIIQPVGIHYINIIHSGYPCFVTYGKQCEIFSNELDLNPENRAKTVLQITRKMYELLHQYVVHIPMDDLYSKKLFVFRVLQWQSLFSKRKSSINEFKKLESNVDTKLELVQKFSSQELERIEHSSFDMGAIVLAADKTLKKRFSLKLLGLLPIYILGLLSTFLPYKLGQFLSKKMVKDIHFTSTAKIISGSIIIPIFWSIIMFVSSWFLGWQLGSIISLIFIVTGGIFLKYNTSYRLLARANSIRSSSNYEYYISAVKGILAKNGA